VYILNFIDDDNDLDVDDLEFYTGNELRIEINRKPESINGWEFENIVVYDHDEIIAKIIFHPQPPPRNSLAADVTYWGLNEDSKHISFSHFVKNRTSLHNLLIVATVDNANDAIDYRFRDMYNHAINGSTAIIMYSLKTGLKEAISGDYIVYDKIYYGLNMDRANPKIATFLTEENLKRLLQQRPPLQINDPLNRNPILSISKVKFIPPDHRSPLFTGSKRRRSLSAGKKITGKIGKKNRQKII